MNRFWTSCWPQDEDGYLTVDDAFATKVVSSIVNGSSNLDEMKRRISLVVKTCLGLLDKRIKSMHWQSDGADEVKSYKKDIQWNIQLNKNRKRFTCECRVLRSSGWPLIFSTTNDGEFPSLGKEVVQEVYEGLPLLVKMVAKDKCIKEDLSYFIWASEVEM